MFAHLHDVWRWVIDIDFLTVAGQDMQDLQRPPPSSRFVPLFFASFRNCFDARGSISRRTRAWPATKRVQRGTRRRSTLQKVRVERCVGLASCVNRRFRLLSLPVTLNQAGALPAIGVQEGERAKRKRARESEVCCFNLQFSPLDKEREKRLNRN